MRTIEDRRIVNGAAFLEDVMDHLMFYETHLKDVCVQDYDGIGLWPNPWSGQAADLNSVSDIPGDRLKVADFVETRFDLRIPPRIFGWDGVEQPAIRGLQVEAKDATRGEQNAKGGQGTRHDKNIGAVGL